MTTENTITSEILRSKFAAVVEDMRATLVNTAHSEAIGEAHECACALLDESAKLVATDSALQMFSLAATTRAIADYFEFDMTAQDVFITNDPYGGGTRVADFTLVVPVAHEDQIVMYLAVRARMSDAGGELVGGINPGAREVWAEGVRITPVKVVRDGRLQNDVLTTILLNSRQAEDFRLDFDAMMAAANVGKQRIAELFAWYGVAPVLRAADWAMEYSARRIKAEISAWPAGEYRGEAILDHDGHGRRGIAVRVNLTVSSGGLNLNFEDSDSQSTAFINSTYANTCGYALLPVLAAAESSIPVNSGLAVNVTIKTRNGTVVDAELPACTGWSHHHIGNEISEAVTAALARFIPERITNVTASLPLANSIEQAARHGGTIEQLANRDYSSFCQGQCDAAHGRDGWGMPGAFAGRPLPSVETYEIETGSRIEKLELVQDSGGAGQWRGGLGSEVVVEFPHDADRLMLNVILENPSVAADRLSGGECGMSPMARIILGDDAIEVGGSSVSRLTEGGGRLVLRMAGGSGWGVAYRREPQAVLRDVLDGFVSIEAAARDYGVIVKPESNEIDVERTRLKRAQGKAG